MLVQMDVVRRTGIPFALTRKRMIMLVRAG